MGILLLYNFISFSESSEEIDWNNIFLDRFCSSLCDHVAENDNTTNIAQYKLNYDQELLSRIEMRCVNIEQSWSAKQMPTVEKTTRCQFVKVQ